MSDVRPALVDLALAKCAPGVAAYEATILDLAARGLLEIGDGPDGPRVTLATPPAAVAGLADYDQQVLGDVRTRLAGAGGRPGSYPRAADPALSEPRVPDTVCDLVASATFPRKTCISRLTPTSSSRRGEDGG